MRMLYDHGWYLWKTRSGFSKVPFFISLKAGGGRWNGRIGTQFLMREQKEAEEEMPGIWQVKA